MREGRWTDRSVGNLSGTRQRGNGRRNMGRPIWNTLQEPGNGGMEEGKIRFMGCLRTISVEMRKKMDQKRDRDRIGSWWQLATDV